MNIHVCMNEFIIIYFIKDYPLRRKKGRDIRNHQEFFLMKML